MSKDAVSVLLVGIGGYGTGYVEEMLEHRDDRAKLVGAVEPYPESCKHIERLRELKVPIYATMQDFYGAASADLAVISSPIHLHCEHACIALEHGSNVLCEKPVAPTVQEARRMAAARDAAGKFVAIGYQWSHSDEIQALKKDIRSGIFGRPVRFKSMVQWPRSRKYFSRAWAAKKTDGKGGWILDSVANNATAHYLHNMFYILGAETNMSAKPVEVTAELYRANDIENFDTAAIRTYTDAGTEILFLVTHAVNIYIEPVFELEFENATVMYDENAGAAKTITANFKDGSVKTYGLPDASLKKLWMAVDSVLYGIPPVCGIEAAFSHTLCINGAQDSMPQILDFPSDLKRLDEEKQLVWVEGLSAAFSDCYRAWKLPSEANLSWAKPGKNIDLRKYERYEG